MYAYAAQFDSQNALYQRKYEQLLASTMTVVGSHSSTSFSTGAIEPRPVMIGGAASLLVSIAGVFVSGTAFKSASIISTWTLALLAALFITGVVAGVSLSIARILAPFGTVATTASGRVGSPLIVAGLSLINFLGASALYALHGTATKSLDQATNRLILAVLSLLLVFTLLSCASGTISQLQVLLWGGNFLYFGAIIGWMTRDQIAFPSQ
ncbi:hypothetical protein BH11ARM1_BH11ARM1_16950 [soil metagenome]